MTVDIGAWEAKCNLKAEFYKTATDKEKIKIEKDISNLINDRPNENIDIWLGNKRAALAHILAASNCANGLKDVIEAGGNPWVMDGHGQSPLMWAAMYGCEQAGLLLSDQDCGGIEEEKQVYFALLSASRDGSMRLTDKLSAKSRELRDKGKLRDWAMRINPLHWALLPNFSSMDEKRSRVTIEILEILARDWSPQWKDEKGNNALHNALYGKRHDALFMLLERGADALEKNMAGQSALDLLWKKEDEDCAWGDSVKMEFEEVARALYEKGEIGKELRVAGASGMKIGL